MIIDHINLGHFTIDIQADATGGTKTVEFVLGSKIVELFIRRLLKLAPKSKPKTLIIIICNETLEIFVAFLFELYRLIVRREDCSVEYIIAGCDKYSCMRIDGEKVCVLYPYISY